MKVLFYSADEYLKPFINEANRDQLNITYIPDRLDISTAHKAAGYDAICIFSADEANFMVLDKLHEFKVKLIALRSAGYNNVNLRCARRHGMRVANVPEYSPYAIAEHAVALLLCLNRKLVRSSCNVRNFNLDINNYIGFDLRDKTVGIIGTGKIGSVMCKIMRGFGCKLLVFDLVQNNKLKSDLAATYTDLQTLCEEAEIISLHVPLTSETHYMINTELINTMKPGVFLINTARGSIVDTVALLKGIGAGIIGGYAADVYENERDLFFKDHSHEIPTDELFIKLNAMPNVLITGHHAFLTSEALTNIASTTVYNLICWRNNMKSENDITDF